MKSLVGHLIVASLLLCLLFLLAMFTGSNTEAGTTCTDTRADNSGQTGSCGQQGFTTTTTCEDMSPCGYTLTVLACNNSCTSGVNQCCICMNLQSYNQVYSCQGDPGTCTGGTKSFFGEEIYHCRTVGCHGEFTKECDDVPTW